MKISCLSFEIGILQVLTGKYYSEKMNEKDMKQEKWYLSFQIQQKIRGGTDRPAEGRLQA